MPILVPPIVSQTTACSVSHAAKPGGKKRPPTHFLHPKTVRALRLLLATVAYLVFGAFAFSWFESDADGQLRDEIATARDRLQRKYNFSVTDYAEMERIVVASVPFAAGYQWQFAGAFYFCVVVVTTVGYGHSTPATVRGKLFCMLFALVGIPMSLVMFQSVGERVNTFIGFCLVRVRTLLARGGVHVLAEIKSKHLLFVSLSIGWMTVAVGTVVFHHYEGWSLFHSLYYIVVTLSTIGFGDYVPLQTGNRLQNNLGYVMFTLAFILCGLAIFSACVNLLVLQCMTPNRDPVTARTRLRRFLSLRRSVSGGKSTGNGTGTTATSITGNGTSATTAAGVRGNVMYATRLSRHYRHSRHSELLEGIASDLKARKVLKQSVAKDKQFFTEVYRYYFRRKKPYFTVRRLPSLYIDHLVNTGPTDAYL